MRARHSEMNRKREGYSYRDTKLLKTERQTDSERETEKERGGETEENRGAGIDWSRCKL